MRAYISMHIEAKLRDQFGFRDGRSKCSVRGYQGRVQRLRENDVAGVVCRKAAVERRARRNGRSVNAEAVEILRAETEREDARVVVQRLAELASEMNWPADAPAPEELIREDRDRR